MSLGLLAAAAVVIAGGIACVAGRRALVIAIGAGAMLAASSVVVDPWPPGLIVLERVVGGALAAELLWLGLRNRPSASSASALALPAVVLLAAAAFVVGAGAQQATPGAGPAAALGTALAVVIVSIAALAGRSDGVQRALAALPLVTAAELVRVGLLGAPTALEALIIAGLAVALAAVVALLATPAVTAIAVPAGGPDGGELTLDAEDVGSRLASRRPPGPARLGTVPPPRSPTRRAAAVPRTAPRPTQEEP